MSRNRANQYKSATLSVAMLAALAALGAVGAVGAQATAGADPLPYGPDTCTQGFVWREAGPGDVVCVTPAVRSSTAQQNQAANAPLCVSNPAPGLIPDGLLCPG